MKFIPSFMIPSSKSPMKFIPIVQISKKTCISLPFLLLVDPLTPGHPVMTVVTFGILWQQHTAQHDDVLRGHRQQFPGTSAKGRRAKGEGKILQKIWLYMGNYGNKWLQRYQWL